MIIDGMKVTEALIHVARVIEASKDYLCELDSAVGDGDHGVSMTIGMRTARKTLLVLQQQGRPTPEQAFQAVSDAFGDEVGAASGVLYETAFGAAAIAVAGCVQLNEAKDWSLIYGAIAHEMQAVGKATLGDKTLIDAWAPAASAIQDAASAGNSLAESLHVATNAAFAGVENTRNLIAKRGRASLLGERGRGHQDAGAMSAALIVHAFEEGLTR